MCVRCRKLEIRCPLHPEGVGDQRSEVRSQKSEIRGQTRLYPAARAAQSCVACNFHYFTVSSLSSIMRRYVWAGGSISEIFKPGTAETIEKAIYLIRGERVMFDRDLAKPIWRSHEGFQPGSQASHGKISNRLYVSAYQ